MWILLILVISLLLALGLLLLRSPSATEQLQRYSFSSQTRRLHVGQVTRLRYSSRPPNQACVDHIPTIVRIFGGVSLMTHVELDNIPPVPEALFSRPSAISYTHPRLTRQYPTSNTPSASSASRKDAKSNHMPQPNVNPPADVDAIQFIWNSLGAFAADSHAKFNASSQSTSSSSIPPLRRTASRRSTPAPSASRPSSPGPSTGQGTPSGSKQSRAASPAPSRSGNSRATTPKSREPSPRPSTRSRSRSAPPTEADLIARTYIRHFHKPDNYWFETESGEMRDGPPDLSAHPSITDGDIFYHRFPGGMQLWIWHRSGGKPPTWKPISVGYQRSDGKRLHLTEKRKDPSWVGEDWLSKQQRKEARAAQKK